MTTALAEHLRSNSNFPTCQVCSEMYLFLPFYQVHIRHTCYALTATYPTMHLGQARAAATVESVQFKERTYMYLRTSQDGAGIL